MKTLWKRLANAQAIYHSTSSAMRTKETQDKESRRTFAVAQ